MNEATKTHSESHLLPTEEPHQPSPAWLGMAARKTLNAVGWLFERVELVQQVAPGQKSLQRHQWEKQHSSLVRH